MKFYKLCVPGQPGSYNLMYGRNLKWNMRNLTSSTPKLVEGAEGKGVTNEINLSGIGKCVEAICGPLVSRRS